MKFSIGDIVSLKNTGEEGRVVAIISHEMVEVEAGGTTFPVFTDEVEHPYLNWFLNNKQRNEKRPSLSPDNVPPFEQSPKTASGFHLSFMPEYKLGVFDEMIDKLRIYFINETAYTIALKYKCTTRSGLLFSHHTSINAFCHCYLHDVPFEYMHEQPLFTWEIVQQQDKRKVSLLSDAVKLKPKKLFDHIVALQRDNLPMFNILLKEDFPFVQNEKLIPEHYNIERSGPASPNNTTTCKPVDSIDLHIDKLVRDTSALTNYEMLQLQIDAFEQALDNAIQCRQHSLTVIHGVGKGRLKDEIHRILRSVAAVSHFQHGWSPRYGLGATDIFFK